MEKRIVGVIGGTGLYQMNDLEKVREVHVATPFGKPSGPYVKGIVDGVETVFVARHGKGHRWLPTEVNSRAIIYGMKKLGVTRVISVSAVGSLKEEMAPGHVVIPDQFIDRTTQRPNSFFGKGIVAHVSLADPFCPVLRDVLSDAVRSRGATVHTSGTYLCMEGPQFSTRAESHLYRSWGAHVIGMTNFTEARLAREAEICYATLALVSDYDCWNEHAQDVDIQQVMTVLNNNVQLAQAVIRRAVSQIPQERSCFCSDALRHAIITERKKIPKKTLKDLKVLVGKYL